MEMDYLNLNASGAPPVGRDQKEGHRGGEPICICDYQKQARGALTIASQHSQILLAETFEKAAHRRACPVPPEAYESALQKARDQRVSHSLTS
jgi:hypothetical protein